MQQAGVTACNEDAPRQLTDEIRFGGAGHLRAAEVGVEENLNRIARGASISVTLLRPGRLDTQ